MKLFGILFLGISVAANASEGLPKKGSLITDVAGAVQTVRISEVDLKLVRCTGREVSLNQRVTLSLGAADIRVADSALFELVDEKAGCSDLKNIRSVMFLGKRTDFRSAEVKISFNLDTDGIDVSGFNGPAGIGKITEKY